MISINKPHTGWHDAEKDLRVDWNSLLCDDPAVRFTRYTGRYFPHADDYVRYLNDFAHGLNIRYGRRVTRVGRVLTGGFVVTCGNGETFEAERVIVATGFGAMNIARSPASRGPSCTRTSRSTPKGSPTSAYSSR
jgi:glycine/D-amino acid oxidase-like deaminating enzyme